MLLKFSCDQQTTIHQLMYGQLAALWLNCTCLDHFFLGVVKLIQYLKYLLFLALHQRFVSYCFSKLYVSWYSNPFCLVLLVTGLYQPCMELSGIITFMDKKTTVVLSKSAYMHPFERKEGSL